MFRIALFLIVVPAMIAAAGTTPIVRPPDLSSLTEPPDPERIVTVRLTLKQAETLRWALDHGTPVPDIQSDQTIKALDRVLPPRERVPELEPDAW
jgi:hypothetical protein